MQPAAWNSVLYWQCYYPLHFVFHRISLYHFFHLPVGTVRPLTKPIDVFNQPLQLQPPPPSGESTIPPPGMVLNQQLGRMPDQVLTLFELMSHMAMLRPEPR
jgi:hypothetical protein